jgi:hypothetical protein
MSTAKEIFSKVQEAVASNPAWQISLPDAHLNLANVYLASKVLALAARNAYLPKPAHPSSRIHPHTQ